ncbi:MAG: hypothetical protein KA152_17995, partial [Verrucomicrobiales bacterium]|nr:hypothetical protein [Verrucomicrobiales bacterium]
MSPVRTATLRLFAKRWSLQPRRWRPHHFRFLTRNHCRPIAATVKTAMMLNGVVKVGAPLPTDGGVSSLGSLFVSDWNNT